MNTIQTPHAQLLQIPTKGKIKFIDINEIYYVKSESNYSQIVLQERKAITVSKTLKHIEACLANMGFIRCHRSYLVNLKYIEEYILGKNPRFKLRNGYEIPTSKEGFIKMKELYGSL